MNPLALREFHRKRNGRLAALGPAEIVADYGDVIAEHAALRESAGVLDLSFRGRLCVAGKDRVRFLHGQVTNDVKRLRVGEGCYAALVSAKGRMESDANIYCLQDELLLDVEPGMAEPVIRRLEKYIVADDVQLLDAGGAYGLLSVQGPGSGRVLKEAGLGEMPPRPFDSRQTVHEQFGEIYLMNQPRLGTAGFDLFAPQSSIEAAAEELLAAATRSGGRPCGWDAFDIARIEAGIPRFGVDMDESNIPLECGIESRAVSYNKGCYVGQEVINRIHSVGHVNRELRLLRLAAEFQVPPSKGDKLYRDGKPVGYLTSVVKSAARGTHLGLGYVRREAFQPGTELILRGAGGESPATVESTG